MENRIDSKVSIQGANVIYFLAAAMLVTVGAFVQSKDFKIGILITEFILIALPPMIYVALKRGNLKYEFRINPLQFTDILLVVLIFTTGYFVAVFLNLLGNIILSFFTKLVTPPIPVATNLNEYFVLLMIIAGSAGLCEEILFRGLMLRAYEKMGMWGSILVSSILFSIIHMNLQNLVAPFFLGGVLGYVVYKTNSILAGIIGHFVNNAISVTLGFLIAQMPMYRTIAPESVNAGLETSALIVGAVFFGVVALFTGALMAFSLIALSQRHEGRPISRKEIPILKVFTNIKLSWPLYLSIILFLGWTTLDLLTRTGLK